MNKTHKLIEKDFNEILQISKTFMVEIAKLSEFCNFLKQYAIVPWVFIPSARVKGRKTHETFQGYIRL
ncbi:MAG: hypothetical protein LBR47_05115 [Spirochaetaceae bacterium]|jgi:hypothetical protein|nr:hypothetical protein [Spirochaetaceae bacterium]